MSEPTVDISHLLSDEQIDALGELALERGVSVEQIAVEAIDRYVLHESGQNN